MPRDPDIAQLQVLTRVYGSERMAPGEGGQAWVAETRGWIWPGSSSL